MTDADVKETKLLLHACCGPCSLEPVRLLRQRGIEPHLYYANPNIFPEDEYQRRLETLRCWAKEERLEADEGGYEPEAWEKRVGFLANGSADRKARCRACYRLRLEQSARFACEHGFNTLATTLTVSPHQFTDIIEDELRRASAKAGLRFLFEDWRPYYREAVRRSRDAGMYRQNYCGCRRSVEEAAAERAARKQERLQARAEASVSRAAADAARAEEGAARRAARAAYAEKQARKRSLLKAFKAQMKAREQTDKPSQDREAQ